MSGRKAAGQIIRPPEQQDIEAAAPNGLPFPLSGSDKNDLAKMRANCRRQVINAADKIFAGLIAKAEAGQYNQAKLLFELCGFSSLEKLMDEKAEMDATLAEFKALLDRVYRPPAPPAPPALPPGHLQSED